MEYTAGSVWSAHLANGSHLYGDTEAVYTRLILGAHIWPQAEPLVALMQDKNLHGKPLEMFSTNPAIDILTVEYSRTFKPSAAVVVY